MLDKLNHRRRHRQNYSEAKVETTKKAYSSQPTNMNRTETNPSFTWIMISACLYVLSGVSQVGLFSSS